MPRARGGMSPRARGIHRAGVARVAFTLDRSGSVRDVAITASSGSPVLDRLAERTVRRAAPMPAPPAALSDDALRFAIPFSFE
ncbi:MAG: energy transducer TonB [Pseudomonadota bacterium]